MEAALEIAGFEGWSDNTLVKAAVRAGMAPQEAHRLFPGGVREAFTLYSEMLNEQLAAEATATNLEEMRTHERVIWLVRKRLEIMEPHKEAVRRLVAISLLPGYNGQAMQALWQACDTIWYLAGDRSTDFNYYTKRGLLAKVYSATLVVWLEDHSPDQAETWAFLEARIGDVLTIGKQLGMANQRLSSMTENFADQLLNRNRYRAKRRR